MFKHVPYFRQKDAMDCGPTSLMMIAAFHGKRFPQTYLRDLCFLSREGVSAAGITEGAERVGFQAMTVKVSYAVPKPDEGCLLNAPLPCIVPSTRENQNHLTCLNSFLKP